jgi:hypothetical protein
MADKSTLMLHCGGKPITRDELDLIPMPVETPTYKPVSHYALTRRVETISQDLLKGFTLDRESFGVNKDGAQLFALLTFRNASPEMGLSIGFRNSLDKSMSIGLACGASVFVCDNMALRGSIEISRKHTGEVWQELEDRLIAVCYRAGKTYDAIVDKSSQLKQIAYDDRSAFEIMGVLYGEEIISPRQLTTVRAQWLKPDHEAFQPRTAWSLYNACTEALKTSPPSQVMENHVNLSKFFDTVIDAEYDDTVPAVIPQ